MGCGHRERIAEFANNPVALALGQCLRSRRPPSCDAGYRRAIHIWDWTEDRELLRCFPQDPSDDVALSAGERMLAFSPDGKTLLAFVPVLKEPPGSPMEARHASQLWDPWTGQPKGVLERLRQAKGHTRTQRQSSVAGRVFARPQIRGVRQHVRRDHYRGCGHRQGDSQPRLRPRCRRLGVFQ